MPETFSYFNHAHWIIVYSERRRLGLPSSKIENEEISGHPLLGLPVIENRTGRTFTITKVSRAFYFGYFLQVVIEREGSHSVKWVENMSSTSQFVHTAVADFLQEYTIQYPETAA